MNRVVEFSAWRDERRRWLGRQTEILEEHGRSRSHRPRSDEEWAAITAGVRAELARREASGRWRWVGQRRVRVESE